MNNKLMQVANYFVKKQEKYWQNICFCSKVEKLFLYDAKLQSNVISLICQSVLHKVIFVSSSKQCFIKYLYFYI